jgi:hypothetical protein
VDGYIDNFIAPSCHVLKESRAESLATV